MTDTTYAATGQFSYLKPQDRPIMFLNRLNKEIARITAEGIMQFTVEANDENAAKFVECIESALGRRLTGIEVRISHPRTIES